MPTCRRFGLKKANDKERERKNNIIQRMKVPPGYWIWSEQRAAHAVDAIHLNSSRDTQRTTKRTLKECRVDERHSFDIRNLINSNLKVKFTFAT